MNTQSFVIHVAVVAALLTLTANAQTGTPATSGGGNNSGVPAANGAPTPTDVERPTVPSARIGPGRNDLTPEEQKKQDELDKARAREREAKKKASKDAQNKASPAATGNKTAPSSPSVTTPAPGNADKTGK